VGHEGGELLAQRVKALGSTVLQGCTGVFCQGFLAGFLDALHVKHGTIRKAAGKADDAGLAQQLKQLADGGGFYVLQAGGELEWHGGR
jgi:hypothetical protein